jgi:hypothetical protein
MKKDVAESTAAPLKPMAWNVAKRSKVMGEPVFVVSYLLWWLKNISLKETGIIIRKCRDK